MKLLDGRIIRDRLADTLRAEIAHLSYVPRLEIIDVGGTPETASYVNQKKIFGERIGVSVRHTVFPMDVSEDVVLSHIASVNQEKEVRGIIVQLPLPEALVEQRILDAVDQHKDVDGLHTKNIEALYNGGDPLFVPATARGVMELLGAYEISQSGKAVVIGASFLTGKPIAELLRRRGMEVVICNSETREIEEIARTADILVSATGVPRLINREFVAEGQTVIDVGYALVPTDEGMMVVGDVDFEAVKDIVSAITPVPGGVGPMTVVGLFENVVVSARRL